MLVDLLRRFPITLLVWCVCAAPAGAQTRRPVVPPPATQPNPQPPPRPAAPAAASPAASVDVPADFVIGPGDVLGVLFWREAEVSGDVTVRPDGQVTLPMIGAMQAAGLRPEALQKQIQSAAGKFFTEPSVTVVVRTINSRKVFVTGRVLTPGAHSLVAPLTVLQAIALSGGVTEFADKKNVTILRVDKGQSRTIKFNYQDVIRGKSLEQNIQLQPGDTIVVP